MKNSEVKRKRKHIIGNADVKSIESNSERIDYLKESKDAATKGIKASGFGVLILLALFGVCLSDCNSPAHNVDQAQEGVNEAQEDLNKAQAEYLADVDHFKAEIQKQITKNETEIYNCNQTILNSKTEVADEYRKKIGQLEQRNNELKLKMSEYKADKMDKWTSYKEEFSRDMDELKSALKNLTVDN